MPYSWVNQACGKKVIINNNIEQFTDVIGRFSFDFTVIVTWITKTGAQPQQLYCAIPQHYVLVLAFVIAGFYDVENGFIMFSFLISMVSIQDFFPLSGFNENDVLKCFNIKTFDQSCVMQSKWFLFHKCLKKPVQSSSRLLFFLSCIYFSTISTWFLNGM